MTFGPIPTLDSKEILGADRRDETDVSVRAGRVVTAGHTGTTPLKRKPLKRTSPQAEQHHNLPEGTLKINPLTTHTHISTKTTQQR